MNALDLILQVTATVEPGYSLEDRMRKYGLDPKLATIRNGVIIEYHGDVNLSNRNLTKIPFRFVKVTGDFWCHRNQLTSLAGCPREVGGYFECSHNRLTSLVGGPEKVGGSFWCGHNRLTSLAGGPKDVGKSFNCGNNPGSAGFEKPEGVKGKFYNVSTLGTLAQVTATVEPGSRIEEHMREYGLDPKLATIRNNIIVEYRGTVDLSNKKLTKIPFRFVKVTGNFWCDGNRLTSLAGCPKEVRNFSCADNLLTSLVGCPEQVSGDFYCYHNQLTSLTGCPEKIGGSFYCHDNPGSAGFIKPKGVNRNFRNV